MLIGIDMLGVQSPGCGGRESGRLGLGLVSALLAGDPVNRYLLYCHEGLSTDRVPSSRNALRVTLPSDDPTRLRSIIQRVLDHNPDGLDWLLLLDPFDPAYGGLPPESPLSGVKVASLVDDLAPNRVDDRRLAPLRRHDALLAFSDSAAEECRRRMPSATRRIKRLSLALDVSNSFVEGVEPLGVASGDDLARLGISGPFLFASLATGTGRSNLAGLLEAYHRLPFPQQKAHQLVIGGEVENPWAAVAYLHDHGCAEGLVLVGEVDEPTLHSLYSRCSAFVSPSFEEGSGLSLLEALSWGAPVVAGRAGQQPDILGTAGLLADPSDPSEIAGQVALLLSDEDLAQGLREKALARSRQFPWEPVVGDLLSALKGEEARSTGPRLRFDRAHVARPRIAIFATRSRPGSAGTELDDQVLRACRDLYDIDLYFDPKDAAVLERLSTEFGGFDARQFARNDDILNYHAVVSIVPDVFSVKAKLGQLRSRPGLVLLQDETSLGRVGLDLDFDGGSSDLEAELALDRVRRVFLTSSRLGVRSRRNREALTESLPGFDDRIFEVSKLAEQVELASIELPRRSGRARQDGLRMLMGLPSASHLPGVASPSEDARLAKG